MKENSGVLDESKMIKLDGLKQEELDQLMEKSVRVRATGPDDIFVGYYNHLRRRGGDVFILRPIVRNRKNPETKKLERYLISAEMQFSPRWMERVDDNAAESAPKHFNEIGRGKKRNPSVDNASPVPAGQSQGRNNAAKNNKRPKLNIPGMTHTVGEERVADSQEQVAPAEQAASDQEVI